MARVNYRWPVAECLHQNTRGPYEMADQLADLEQRVTARWTEAFTARFGADPFDADNGWRDDGRLGIGAIGPATPQFPREQWAIQPARRTVVLMLCDRLIDIADQLDDGQWHQLGFLMQYGGKVRLS